MSNHESRNQPFDYTPPARSGSASGALILIGAIVVLFLLGMLFLGGETSPLPQDGAVAPSDGAPLPAIQEAVPAIGPVEGTLPAVPAE